MLGWDHAVLFFIQIPHNYKGDQRCVGRTDVQQLNLFFIVLLEILWETLHHWIILWDKEKGNTKTLLFGAKWSRHVSMLNQSTTISCVRFNGGGTVWVTISAVTPWVTAYVLFAQVQLQEHQDDGSHIPANGFTLFLWTAGGNKEPDKAAVFSPKGRKAPSKRECKRCRLQRCMR